MSKVQTETKLPITRRARIRNRFLFDLIPGISNFDQSKTKQSFAKEADINNIMGKYTQTGILVDPLVPRTRKPMYGDFSEMPNLHTIKCNIKKLEESFETLPSKLRDRFENSVENLLNFMANPENTDECVKLGLKPIPLAAQVPGAPTPLPNGETPSNDQPDGKEQAPNA